MLLHELSDGKLGLLKDLHLTHEHVLEREDALCLLLDLLADGFWDQLLDQITELIPESIGKEIEKQTQ